MSLHQPDHPAYAHYLAQVAVGVNRISMVGMNHQNSEAIVTQLGPGAPVTLVREPDNKFDKNAVAVWVDGKRIGYIPKTTNRPLAALIDASGYKWTPPAPVLAADEKATTAAPVHMALDAKFTRSPNSGYPQVVVGA